MRRPREATFGASYVFPGGVLEGDDGRAAALSVLSARAANRCLGLERGGLAWYCAAIRELFEETGVLLARGRQDTALPPRPVLVRAREALNGGTLRWSDFLEGNGLVLACDALHYVAWWITPRARPKRFSTRFFVAALPQGQQASHDGRELTDSRWTTVADALAGAQVGALALPPPTVATLRELARFDDLEELLGWARGRAAEGVPRILPAIIRQGGRDRVVMPGDPDYPPDADAGET